MSDPTSDSPGAIRFPKLAARDLEGRARALPDEFAGAFNLVLVAFRRAQQPMVDSWVAWYGTIAGEHPTLRCYEVPVIATRWSPARPVVDGGMAKAVREQEARQRTLTVYTDVRRVTDALAIDDTDTITALLVDGAGRVRWRTTGPATEQACVDLLEAVGRQVPEADNELPSVEQFEFAFDQGVRAPLALAGVTPGTAHVTLSLDRLTARFGPWTCTTSINNVREVSLTGPYSWYKVIGPRWSLADHGLTFGTGVSPGVCLLFHEPVPGLAPVSVIRHPGLTLTLSDPERFAASVRRRSGLHRA